MTTVERKSEPRLQLAEEEVEMKVDPANGDSISVVRVNTTHLSVMLVDNEELANAARGFKIVNDQQYQASIELSAELKRRIKAAEKEYKEINDPLNELKKTVKTKADAVINPLKEGDAIIGKAQIDFHRRQEEERRKQQAILDAKAQKDRERYEVKLAKAEERGVTPPAPPAPIIAQAPAKTVAAQSGATLTMKKVVKAEIINEALVPRFLCIPSMPLINGWKQTADRKEALEKYGIRIYDDYERSQRT